MTLMTRYNRYNDLNEFVNRIFGEMETTESCWAPRMDLRETADAYDLLVEIPGYDKKDIKVELEDNILSVSGNREAAKVEDGSKVTFSEIRQGKFHRRVKFPAHIESDKIKASYSNGLLHLNIPKQEKAKAMTISVN